MKILSHRGYWKRASEKNTPKAFEYSFIRGFGTETDVRDFKGELVISHDIAQGNEMSFIDFLTLVEKQQKNLGSQLSLALNIKSDGLANKINQSLKKYSGNDFFVFDMSVPDMRSYFEAGIPVFTRMSEVEKEPAWLDKSDGVWLDGFETEWYGADVICDLLDRQKRVCIVSPELHSRSHILLWERLNLLQNKQGLLLCTDYPELAADFFNGIEKNDN
jgi:hypothetical protein